MRQKYSETEEFLRKIFVLNKVCGMGAEVNLGHIWCAGVSVCGNFRLPEG